MPDLHVCFFLFIAMPHSPIRDGIVQFYLPSKGKGAKYRLRVATECYIKLLTRQTDRQTDRQT